MSSLSNLVKSASTILPQVPKPTRKPAFNERLVWTGIVLVVYLVMAQIPLFGVPRGLEDPFAFTRIIFASSSGTLMSLGIGPIVTAGLILQLLKGADILKFDFKKPDQRALFQSATKLLTVIVTFVEALFFVIGGAFGQNLSQTTVIVVMLQLMAAGIMVMLLDETIQKGWGIGSGVSLFIMAGVAQQIIWQTFSPVETGEGPTGAIAYLIAMIGAGRPEQAFFRGVGQLPSILGLIATLIIILVNIYVEGYRIEIPITSSRYRGFSGVYPLKLLYVSNVPIILVSALVANVRFLAQVIWSRFNSANDNPLLNLLVTLDPSKPGVPTGGLLFYISPPGGFTAAVANPLHALTYVGFITLFAVIFGKVWVEVGGLSSKKAAEGLIDAKIQVPGFRRADSSIESILNKYIPTITIVGSIFIGLLASVSDIFGAFGSGTGILLMVSITLQYYQNLVKEHLESVMPRLAGVLGVK